MDKRMDAIHHLDEATEGFAPPNVSNKEYNDLQAASTAQQISHGKMALFRAMQIHWVESLISLKSKFATINQGNSTLCPHDFTTSEVIIWQIVSISKDMFKNRWYDLPGLADFWLEDFDFDGYG